MEVAGLVLLAAGGALIGSLLALLGAGGSILLLPLLVSGAHLSTREAVPLSLLVVLLLALANLGPCLRRGQVAARPALLLGLPALLGSWIGGRWVQAGAVPEPLQLALFASAALFASWLLLRPSASPLRCGPSPHGASAGRSASRTLLLVGQGLLVGLLTGIAGVGGGFAIVPALVLLARLPMPLASGTSLLLIAANALVAFLALNHWPAASLPLLPPLLLGGGVGTVLGRRLAPQLKERQLRRGFAALLIGAALLSAAEAVKRHHTSDPGTATSRGPGVPAAQPPDRLHQGAAAVPGPAPPWSSPSPQTPAVSPQQAIPAKAGSLFSTPEHPSHERHL